MLNAAVDKFNTDFGGFVFSHIFPNMFFIPFFLDSDKEAVEALMQEVQNFTPRQRTAKFLSFLLSVLLWQWENGYSSGHSSCIEEVNDFLKDQNFPFWTSAGYDNGYVKFSEYIGKDECSQQWSNYINYDDESVDLLYIMKILINKFFVFGNKGDLNVIQGMYNRIKEQAGFQILTNLLFVELANCMSWLGVEDISGI